jgi:hypothetical protein
MSGLETHGNMKMIWPVRSGSQTLFKHETSVTLLE